MLSCTRRNGAWSRKSVVCGKSKELQRTSSTKAKKAIKKTGATASRIAALAAHKAAKANRQAADANYTRATAARKAADTSLKRAVDDAKKADASIKAAVDARPKQKVCRQLADTRIRGAAATNENSSFTIGRSLACAREHG